MNGGKIEAGWYAVSGNGTNRTYDGDITINGGELVSVADYAIYNPQKGTLAVNGGVVCGQAGGIALNAGDLVMSGGTVTSKGKGDTGDWGDGTGGLDNAAINVNAKYGDAAAKITAEPSSPKAMRWPWLRATRIMPPSRCPAERSAGLSTRDSARPATSPFKIRTAPTPSRFPKRAPSPKFQAHTIRRSTMRIRRRSERRHGEAAAKRRHDRNRGYRRKVDRARLERSDRCELEGYLERRKLVARFGAKRRRACRRRQGHDEGQRKRLLCFRRAGGLEAHHQRRHLRGQYLRRVSVQQNRQLRRQKRAGGQRRRLLHPAAFRRWEQRLPVHAELL